VSDNSVCLRYARPDQRLLSRVTILNRSGPYGPAPLCRILWFSRHALERPFRALVESIWEIRCSFGNRRRTREWRKELPPGSGVIDGLKRALLNVVAVMCEVIDESSKMVRPSRCRSELRIGFRTSEKLAVVSEKVLAISSGSRRIPVICRPLGT